MVVFRIVSETYSASLQSPGIAGRWNLAGTYVIYASATRSLACLENIVHRSSVESPRAHSPQLTAGLASRKIKKSYGIEESSQTCCEVLQLLRKFRCMIIEIPDDMEMESVSPRLISGDWFTPESFVLCQQKGNEWAVNRKSCVLRVPSAVIPQEHNFVIHMKHHEFKRVRLKGTESFYFDKRLIN